MKLSIIIVSYNSANYLRTCLSSIYRELNHDKNLHKSTEIIVVDNASQDNSIGLIKERFSQAILIVNKQNLGFAKANNQGIMKAQGKFLLLLNPDLELGNKSLSQILDVIEKNPNVGVTGCKLINSDGSIQPSSGYFPNLGRILLWMTFIDDIPFLSHLLKPYHVESKSFYSQEQKVDWVTGACMLVRSDAVVKAGIMDEQIFMY